LFIEQSAKLQNRQKEHIIKDLLEAITLVHISEPEDIAKLVFYLASKDFLICNYFNKNNV
jgi:hypothetical protein